MSITLNSPWTNQAFPIKVHTSFLLPISNLTNQDVDTEYSEAGHTPTETDYFYEETVPLPEGEVIGQEDIQVQVKKMSHLWRWRRKIFIKQKQLKYQSGGEPSLSLTSSHCSSSHSFCLVRHFQTLFWTGMHYIYHLIKHFYVAPVLLTPRCLCCSYPEIVLTRLWSLLGANTSTILWKEESHRNVWYIF